MSQGLLIGLDVGTTTSKAVAFTLEGDPVATGRAATPWEVSGDRVQLDARRLVEAARSAIAQIGEALPDEEILGIGIASMGEAGVLLDSARQPIAPVIAWHDRRDSWELENLKASIDPAAFSRRTGLPVGQQWSLTKHRWLVDHLPAAGNAELRLNIAEWVAFSLGAAPVTEQSLASRTGWLDLERRQWSEELLDWSGAKMTMLPQLVTAGTRVGNIGAGSGLAAMAGAAITIAGHDHQAAAVGAGAIGSGDELDSCGTADALVRTINPGLDEGLITRLTDAGVTVGWHALEDRWCLLGATQGGLVLQRALAMLGIDRDGLPSLDGAAMALDAPSVTASISNGAVLTLTDIQDETAPHHVWRAAVEATTDQVAVIHDAMSALTGPHRKFIVTGGWARSEAVLAVKRRRFGTLHHLKVTEAGARGAALFAGVAAGFWPSPAEARWYEN
jgi:sugar (pentulose or hexulose) kinase